MFAVIRQLLLCSLRRGKFVCVAADARAHLRRDRRSFEAMQRNDAGRERVISHDRRFRRHANVEACERKLFAIQGAHQRRRVTDHGEALAEHFFTADK
jgi:hypothetical protein